MYYYLIIVTSQKYHGSEPLTYSSERQLQAGSLVVVPLGKTTTNGIVIEKTSKPSFQTKDISTILSDKPLPAQLIKLYNWISEYYPGPQGITASLLVPSNLNTTSRRKKQNTIQGYEMSAPPKLTDEQQSVLRGIEANTKATSFLLHGETGSGKTRVYVELSKKVLATGKSVIILTPEIGLSPQITTIFQTAFPDRITNLNSKQTAAERRDNWLAIHTDAQPQVVIGPRSALFAPLSAIGLIIIDECHDAAYKQDSMPYYQTTRVAAVLAKLHSAKLVLGSATPLVGDYYTFLQKNLPILRMKASAKGTSAVQVSTVDLKNRQLFSRSPWLSDELILDIQNSLQEGLQSLVFLNRRGTARLVICTNCSWQANCPRCDLPLTYHGDSHDLQCHTCGYKRTTVLTCPSCNKPDVAYKSIGTKTLLSEVSRLFPDASIARFDSDNTKVDSLASQYENIQKGTIDILVGTQVMSKGLDLPLLKVVGIVVADTGLFFPDFSAEEKTFQMLRQVIGRVGRGHIDGKVVVQAYNPNSMSVKAAVNKDYEHFYATQISERESYNFPPFFYVLKVSVERASSKSAEKAAERILEDIQNLKLPVQVTDPTPAFIERAHDKFKWQLILRSKKRSALVDIIHKLPKNCSYDIDPTNLL